MEFLTLARRLELGPLPLDESSRVLIRVAGMVESWHERGILHRELNAASISLGATTDDIDIAEPSDDALSCGGPDWDPEVAPAGLSPSRRIAIPRDLSAARAVFKESRIELDPTQIDIYQMGTLFCRLLTGETTMAYLSSPRTKSRVPEKWRALLDRSLGGIREGQWTSASQFADALRSQQESTSNTRGSADASAGSPPTGEPLPLKQIGTYEIRNRIGRGGMGDVYDARDLRTNRIVAIKVLPAELARHTDFVRRFYAEAAAASTLAHPNIIQILHVGEDAGHHFFAMEYVEGESLAERLTREKSLGVAESLQISQQLLSALAAAHEQGLIHRDIKPGNILLDPVQNRAVLADFGLVKSLQETTDLTATGVVVGSVHYISPEQARGKTVDRRSDLYSFGVLLYQMLSGTLPFTGEGTTALIFQHVYEPPRSLIDAAPSVSPVLSVIVEKLLAKSPADRYARAEDVANDLDAYLRGKPLPSGADIVDLNDDVVSEERPLAETAVIAAPHFGQLPSVPLPEIPAEPESVDDKTIWFHRMQRGVWNAFRHQAPQLADMLQDTQQKIDGALAEYERRQRDLHRTGRKALQVLQELRNQRDEWEAAAAAIEVRLPTTVDKFACLEEQARCQKNISELTELIKQQQDELSDMRLQQAKVTATLERMRSQHNLLQARMKVAEASLRLSGRKRRRKLAVSVAGLFGLLALVVLVWVALDGAKIWNTSKTGITYVVKLMSRPEIALMPLGISEDRLEAPQQRLKANTDVVDSVVFSSDGQQIYGGGRNGHLVAWDLHSGRPTGESIQRASIGVLRIDPVTDQPCSQNVVWAKDLGSEPFRYAGISAIFPTGNPRQAIVFGPLRGDGLTPLMLYNLEQNAILQIIAKGPQLASYAVDASVLVHTNPEDGAIHLWSLKEKREVRVIERAPAPSQFSIDVSSDAKWMAFFRQTAKGEVAAHIEVWNLESGRLQFKRGFRGKQFSSLAFQPGSGLLAVAGNDMIELWDLQRQIVCKRFQGSEIGRIAFSPDGRMLGAGTGSTVTIWDAIPDARETTGDARTLKGVGPAALSPDGSRYWSFVDGDLVAHRLADDQPERRFGRNFGASQFVILSDDESQAVLGSNFGKKENGYNQAHTRLELLNIESATVSHAITFPVSALPCQFSRNGRTVYVAQDRQLLSWDIETGNTAILVPDIGPGAKQCMAVSPDGRQIAIGGWDQSSSESIFAVFNADERNEVYRHVFKDHFVNVLRFSDDGSKLALGSRTQVVIWDVSHWRIQGRIPASSPFGISGISFSPHGNLVATCGKSTGIALWQSITGDQVLSLFEKAKTPYQAEWVGFTPDGRHLIATGPGQPILSFDTNAETRPPDLPIQPPRT